MMQWAKKKNTTVAAAANSGLSLAMHPGVGYPLRVSLFHCLAAATRPPQLGRDRLSKCIYTYSGEWLLYANDFYIIRRCLSCALWCLIQTHV